MKAGGIDNVRVYLEQPSASGAYESSFELDKTGPRVVDTSFSDIAEQGFDHIDFEFDTPLSASSFTTGDITLVGPGGMVDITNFERLSAREYRIEFDRLTNHGVYQLSIGPELTDLAGNSMDQNENGINGEFQGDAYIQVHVIRFPDLVPVNPVAPASAAQGEVIEIYLGSRNNDGESDVTDRWTDAIYLSSNETLDSGDLLLRSIPRSVEIAAGTSAPISVPVPLPLDDQLPEGPYHLLIVTDAEDSTSESDEGNNVIATSAIQIGFPPTPDLIVSDIDAPPQVQSEQVAIVEF